MKLNTSKLFLSINSIVTICICFSITRYQESELIKLDIQINGDPVEPLSTIVHRDKVMRVF